MARRSHKASAATRAKESAAHKGKKHPHRGHAATSATRAKESAAHRGKKHPHRGHRATAATRARISKSLKGRHLHHARRKSARHTKHKAVHRKHVIHRRKHLAAHRKHLAVHRKHARNVVHHPGHRRGTARHHAKGRSAKTRMMITPHARWHHKLTHAKNSHYLRKKRRSKMLWRAHKGFGKTQILQSGTF